MEKFNNNMKFFAIAEFEGQLENLNNAIVTLNTIEGSLSQHKEVDYVSIAKLFKRAMRAKRLFEHFFETTFLNEGGYYFDNKEQGGSKAIIGFIKKDLDRTKTFEDKVLSSLLKEVPSAFEILSHLTYLTEMFSHLTMRSKTLVVYLNGKLDKD